MQHIKELDGLRGVLALWVVAAHVALFSGYREGYRVLHPSAAVDVFVILSGFVIFYLLHHGEDYRTFITRRFFRLWPVFAVCLALAVSLKLWLGLADNDAFRVPDDSLLAPHLILHGLMLHGAVPREVLPNSALAYLPPAWSVSLEWQFYLLAPLLFAFAVRPGFKTGLVFFGLLALRVLVEADLIGSPLMPWLKHRWTFSGMESFLPEKIELFGLGAMSFFGWKWLGTRPAAVPLRTNWLTFTAPPLAFLLTKNIALTVWSVVILALMDGRYGTNGFAARFLNQLLGGRTWQFLGAISYAVYLVHMPALTLVRHVARRQWPDLTGPQTLAILAIGGLALTIGLAWLLHVSVERPCIRCGKQLTQRWKT